MMHSVCKIHLKISKFLKVIDIEEQRIVVRTDDMERQTCCDYRVIHIYLA